MYDNDQNQKRPNRAVELVKSETKQALKNGAKRVAIKAGKAVGAAAIKGLGAILAAVGWPVLLVTLLIIIVVLFFGAFYWSAPESVMLDKIKMEQSEYDREIRQWAIDEVDRANVMETYLVPGEGQYFPETDFEIIGKLVDNNGLDAKLANEWGDAYSPALWKSFLFEENKLEDEEWVKDHITDNAEELRPYFYYKESSITVCTVDEEGETSCYTYPVYLLVEAYTIRGHNLYTYEWYTETYDDGGSITYERLKDTESLDDGKEYLQTGLEERITGGEPLGIDENDEKMMVRMIWESMLAYSAEKEWLAWLSGNGIDLLRTISSTQIPIEYRAYLTEASELTGIPVHVLAAIIIKESSWNPRAINEKTGCFGLTQLNPQYWEAWCERYGFDPVKDMWNPRAQIIIGAQVLAGYMTEQPKWDSDDWEQHQYFRAALAMYGGYGTDVDDAKGYINRVVDIAKAYETRTGGSPLPGYGRENITSFFGYRLNPTGGGDEDHTGIDFAADIGTPIVSVSSGVVIHSGYGKGGYGNCVWIADGVYTYIYAHMSVAYVSAGDPVYPGLPIGEVGSTGRSTGPHLHFEVRVKNKPIDPLQVINI